MGDADSLMVAKTMYKALLAQGGLDTHTLPYALDAAVQQLREHKLPPPRWATFIHVRARRRQRR
jgi:hypothetical protein